MNYGIKVLQGVTRDERCEARPRYEHRLLPHEGRSAGGSLCATCTGQRPDDLFQSLSHRAFQGEL